MGVIEIMKKARLQPDPEFYLGQAIRGLDDAKVALSYLSGQRPNEIIELKHEINIIKKKVDGLK